METRFSVDITIGNIPDNIYDKLMERIEHAIMEIIEDVDDLNNPMPITIDIGVGLEQE